MVIRNMRDLRLIRMTAAGMNRKVIAAKLGISRQTVGRWLKQPDIQRMIQQYTQHQYELEMEFLEKLQGIAVDTLMEIMVSGTNMEKLKAIELFWKKRGEIGVQVDVSGNIDIHNVSNEELEEKITELKKKLYELMGKEFCPDNTDEE